MSYEDKEIVWLPKKLADKVKGYQEEGKPYENIILQYLDESKNEVKSNLETLDEDVLQYKALMVKAKNAFKEAKEEQLSQSYEIWEDFDKELVSVRSKVEEMKNTISPIKSEIEDIKKLLDGVSSWEIEKFLEVIKEVSNYLAYEGDTAKILRFLFDNYKKDK